MDTRYEFIQAVEERLMRIVDPEMAKTISDEIVQELKTYYIEKKSTELALYNDHDQRLVKRYCACLLIDGKSERTIEQYEATVTAMLKFLKIPIVDIGPYDVRLFLAHEKSRGISNRTLENTRAYISAFFRWLTLEEIVPKNPCLNIKPIKYTEKVREPLNPVDIDHLRRGCIKPRERAILEFFLATGVRVSELTNMKISDVNFSDMSVRVTHGKGNKERTTYMSELAKIHLIKYLETRHDQKNILFVSRTGDALSKRAVRNELKNISKRVGVEDVHPHRLRRTFATNLANRGMAVQDIRRLLGHSDINTTMIYVSQSEEHIRLSYNKYTT